MRPAPPLSLLVTALVTLLLLAVPACDDDAPAELDTPADSGDPASYAPFIIGNRHHDLPGITFPLSMT